MGGKWALENEKHASLMIFDSLGAIRLISNQPQVGWSRTDIRSMRDFLAPMSTH